jgi:hypothetical protein
VGLRHGVLSMSNDTDLVDELFSMAKDPDHFTRADLGEMILIAATEIIKLREFGPLTNSFANASFSRTERGERRLPRATGDDRRETFPGPRRRAARLFKPAT